MSSRCERKDDGEDRAQYRRFRRCRESPLSTRAAVIIVRHLHAPAAFPRGFAIDLCMRFNNIQILRFLAAAGYCSTTGMPTWANQAGEDAADAPLRLPVFVGCRALFRDLGLRRLAFALANAARPLSGPATDPHLPRLLARGGDRRRRQACGRWPPIRGRACTDADVVTCCRRRRSVAARRGRVEPRLRSLLLWAARGGCARAGAQCARVGDGRVARGDSRLGPVGPGARDRLPSEPGDAPALRLQSAVHRGRPRLFVVPPRGAPARGRARLHGPRGPGGGRSAHHRPRSCSRGKPSASGRSFFSPPRSRACATRCRRTRWSGSGDASYGLYLVHVSVIRRC